MITLSVDPALIALSNGLAQNEGELLALIVRLARLEEIGRNCSAIRTIKSSDLESVLIESGSFPSFAGISEIIVENGLSDVFSVKDVITNLFAIISRATSIFDEFGEEVTSISNLSGNVLALFARFPVAVRDISLRSLANLAWIEQRAIQKGLSAVVSGHPEIAQGAIDFKCEVDDFIPSEVASGEAFPISLTGTLRAIDKFEDLYAHGALQIWEKALCAADIHFAIRARAIELLPGLGLTTDDLVQYQIGSEFFDSLQRNQAGRDGLYSSTTLDTCARLILRLPKYPVRPFGGMREDDYDGRRSHITKHVCALRLLFWQSPSGGVEFANIGPKQELEIASGDPAAVTVVSYPTV